eukprot:TRINITY_DN11697_c0_g1_i1.p1 TRINITY_DN11697_c0_g1~~TRINITY_DN11697_c0_g1_i1.p1  ORF type:complete len:414 (+),score=124.10 TRINITY_DN11697_c0_g1_i1:149-1390(+)
MPPTGNLPADPIRTTGAAQNPQLAARNPADGPDATSTASNAAGAGRRRARSQDEVPAGDTAPAPAERNTRRRQSETYTVTFGDQAENHAGMQKIGELAEAGFSVAELREARRRFDAEIGRQGTGGCTVAFATEMHDLAALLPEDVVGEEAELLVVRNGVDLLLRCRPEATTEATAGDVPETTTVDVPETTTGDVLEATTVDVPGATNEEVLEATAGEVPPAALVATAAVPGAATGDVPEATAADMLEEQRRLAYDSKAFMYGKVVNKHARHNICFNDAPQNQCFEEKKGTVVAFRDTPLLLRLRDTFPRFLGDKAKSLKAEGNFYYDTSKCGIGYHGDAERKIVVGVRLGASLPLCYSWFQRSKPVGQKKELVIGGGDLYVMSEKTTGFDWRLKKKATLRHAAGCSKFTKLPS